MVGQDILCKFLVNNVIAYHLWTITSPLIARGGLGIGEYRAPDFCPRRYLSFKSGVEVCLSQVLNIILLFVCHRTITYLLSIWACHIEKPLFFWWEAGFKNVHVLKTCLRSRKFWHKAKKLRSPPLIFIIEMIIGGEHGA